MSGESHSGSEEARGKRRRVHTSSVAVSLLALVLVGIVALPGETWFHIPVIHGHMLPVEVEHGWPLRFLLRDVAWDSPWYNARRKNYPDYGLWGIPWLSTESWAVWQASTFTFSWMAALVDACVLIGIVSFVVVASEWRRRRRLRFLQFHLREMLLAFAVVAAGAGWWGWNRREYARELVHTLAINGAPEDFSVDVVLQEDEFCPLWLRRLIGGRNIPDWFYRVRRASLDLTGDVEPEDLQWLVRRLIELKRLDSLDLTVDSIDQVHAVLEQLGPMLQLREVYIANWGQRGIGLAEARQLSKLPQVRSVVLASRSDVDAAALDLLQLEAPWCKISFEEEL